MKKSVYLAITGILLLSSMGCARLTPAKETSPETQSEAQYETLKNETQQNNAPEITGGWSTPFSPEITPEIKNLCERAFEGINGASYSPAALLKTQIVAGTNYCILPRETPSTPNAKEVYAIGYFYEDLSGNVTVEDLQSTSVETNFNDFGSESESPATGAWTPAESSALTDKVETLFNQALDGLVGVSYHPLALLGTQTVSGTNYAVLCEATVVYPNAEPYYAIVYLNEDLSGKSTIMDIVNLQDSAEATPETQS